MIFLFSYFNCRIYCILLYFDLNIIRGKNNKGSAQYFDKGVKVVEIIINLPYQKIRANNLKILRNATSIL